MNSKKPLTLLVTAALLVAVVAGATSVTAAETLSVEVMQEQDTGDATVTVMRGTSAVANATVNVSSDGSYADTGTHTTDANGTVVLSNPTERVNVTLEVSEGGDTVTKTVELVPRSEALGVDVTQADDGPVTVTVTKYDRAVDDATVNVSSDEPYDGNGTHETDANGTVALPEPNATVDVTVTADDGVDTASTTATLEPRDLALVVDQNFEGNVTVNVTRAGEPVNATVEVNATEADYEGEGTWTATNGTLSLPAPNSTINATFTASEGSDTVTKTVTLEAGLEETPAGHVPFGRRVSAFVHSLLGEDRNGGIGPAVSEFVTEHNPGNAGERGPPEHAGPPEDGERGPPEHAGGPGNDESTGNATASGSDERGPPEHAGPPEDNGGGPPEDRGNGGGNGRGR